MKFDYVHDIQKAYRKLIDCISKPGTINSLSEESRKLHLPVNCNEGILVLALMLLDPEVNFHILGNNAEKVSRKISQLTYSATAPLSEADFIFILEDVGCQDLARAMRTCKLGDLVNPHLSATLIIEVEKITNQKELILKGPGIKEENHINISTPTDWVALRAEKNSEYPLGIEIYFVDKEYNLFALPRTTNTQSRGEN